MTLQQFEAMAVKRHRQQLELPSNFWGTWIDVQGPDGVRIRYRSRKRIDDGSGVWTVSWDGRRISRHASRDAAIKKAQSLLPGNRALSAPPRVKSLFRP